MNWRRYNAARQRAQATASPVWASLIVLRERQRAIWRQNARAAYQRRIARDRAEAQGFLLAIAIAAPDSDDEPQPNDAAVPELAEPEPDDDYADTQHCDIDAAIAAGLEANDLSFMAASSSSPSLSGHMDEFS